MKKAHHQLPKLITFCASLLFCSATALASPQSPPDQLIPFPTEPLPLETPVIDATPHCSSLSRITTVMGRLFPTHRIQEERSASVSSFLLTTRKKPGFDVRLTVLRGPQVNAFAQTNGTGSAAAIHISDRLLRKLATDDELAFVIAHEWAHIARERIPEPLPEAVFTARQLAKIAAVHRQWELDADRDAVEHLRRSAYSPTAAISVLEKLADVDKEPTFNCVRSHPEIRERISQLEAGSQLALRTDEY